MLYYTILASAGTRADACSNATSSNMNYQSPNMIAIQIVQLITHAFSVVCV